MSDSGSFPGYNQFLEMVKTTLAKVIRSSDKVPQHVAFIMDGNRRFAKKNNMEVNEGHNAGFESMCRILELCYESGMKVATVFAFSIENFKRSTFEVNWLMELAKDKIKQISQHGELAEQYGIKVQIIGDRSLLPADVLKEVELAEEITMNNSRAVLNICFPYTGREEIVHSIQGIMKETAMGEIDYRDIDEQTIEDHLYTQGQPPVELLIRTSGVTRLSDFLLWQLSNRGCTIELVDCLWPEFTPFSMLKILIKFAFKKTYSPSNEEDDELKKKK
ncbi:ditrans,polycis-polyprenyl diphosphate synthase [Kluyveromyces lactis]|uniref:Alkyl transferase n=1 Tax=Kluyveromyces lactis (strain ATCC 8585 / CBS 2359 / DSM 70799 / NBRC 1267 / NRRL Y-1140 / WM37) TaxID=284590 RepID=Q6CMW4_KLULA|nr:uncharacterized protein KLLA0_E17205g [Kluyveromyces lactis]CAG99812.1 KLLA0E17205p [Kluyveromyces lactis]|eukprot:XP_454725.1 uncharacterized protein KLLA0_E17205g [Kluyveromyces lactis]